MVNLRANSKDVDTKLKNFHKHLISKKFSLNLQPISGKGKILNNKSLKYTLS